MTLTEANSLNTEFLKVCIKLYIALIRLYSQDIIKTRNFVQMMQIVTEAFNNKGEVKKEIKLFLLEMKSYYER